MRPILLLVGYYILLGNALDKKTTNYNSRGCGLRNPDGIGFKIGQPADEAQYAEFPWMVAILSGEQAEYGEPSMNFKCGGSLIHPKAVLTAAHCVKDTKKIYKIRAGEWDRGTTKEIYLHQDRNVVSINIHPKFNSSNLLNDIAVLILKEPVEIEENVDTVCLPSKGEVIETKSCLLSGWGKDTFDKDEKYKDILKKMQLSIVNRSRCERAIKEKSLGNPLLLDERYLCAGSETGKRPGLGDGGSPLVCPISGHPGRYQLTGIVACGAEQCATLGLYANVELFRDWIDQQMASNNLETSYYTVKQ